MAEHDSVKTAAPQGTDDPEQGPDQNASSQSPSGESGSSETPSVEALQKAHDELFDRLLRKTAEFDNYRKRIERERKEFVEWAAADLLTDLVAIMDDFDRALAADAPVDALPYKTGLELIRHSLHELIRKRGVTEIEALGTAFDPHLHQAVAYEAAEGAEEGTVVEVFRKGYKLGDRLLRPSMVKVAKAS